MAESDPVLSLPTFPAFQLPAEVPESSGLSFIQQLPVDVRDNLTSLSNKTQKIRQTYAVIEKTIEINNLDTVYSRLTDLQKKYFEIIQNIKQDEDNLLLAITTKKYYNQSFMNLMDYLISLPLTIEASGPDLCLARGVLSLAEQLQKRAEQLSDVLQHKQANFAFGPRYERFLRANQGQDLPLLEGPNPDSNPEIDGLLSSMSALALSSSSTIIPVKSNPEPSVTVIQSNEQILQAMSYFEDKIPELMERLASLKSQLPETSSSALQVSEESEDEEDFLSLKISGMNSNSLVAHIEDPFFASQPFQNENLNLQLQSQRSFWKAHGSKIQSLTRPCLSLRLFEALEEGSDEFDDEIHTARYQAAINQFQKGLFSSSASDFHIADPSNWLSGSGAPMQLASPVFKPAVVPEKPFQTVFGDVFRHFDTFQYRRKVIKPPTPPPTPAPELTYKEAPVNEAVSVPPLLSTPSLAPGISAKPISSTSTAPTASSTPFGATATPAASSTPFGAATAPAAAATTATATTAAAPVKDPQYWMAKVKELYEKHNPEKVKDLETKIYPKYQDKHDLYLQVCKKYNVKPEEATSAPPATPAAGTTLGAATGFGASATGLFGASAPSTTPATPAATGFGAPTSSLFGKPSTAAPSTPFGAAATTAAAPVKDPQYWMAKVKELYEKHNPEKVKDLETKIYPKYQDKHDLYLQVCKKYNVKPEEATSAPPATPATGFGSGGSSLFSPVKAADGASNALGSTPFGQSSSLFGKPSTAAPSTPFGSSSATSSTPFGAAAATSTPFGAKPTTSSTPFGAPSATSSTPFGASSATSSTPFGAASATSSTPFGSASTSSTPFGSSTGTSSTPFGASATSSTPFGTSSTPFGSSATSSTPFGSSATSSTPFGSSTTSSTPFGSSATSSTPFGASGQSSLFNNTSSFGGSSFQNSAIGANNNAVSAGATGAINPDAVAERVKEIYQSHNPSKLLEIPSLLAKYKNDLLGLVSRLETKYSVPPVDPSRYRTGSTSAFGAPAAGGFGAPAAGGFGAGAPAAGGFGAPAAGGFGAGQSSVFGNTNNTGAFGTSSAFGAQPQGSSGFGASSAFGAQSQATSGFGFGAKPAGTSLFGNNSFR